MSLKKLATFCETFTFRNNKMMFLWHKRDKTVHLIKVIVVALSLNKVQNSSFFSIRFTTKLGIRQRFNAVRIHLKCDCTEEPSNDKLSSNVYKKSYRSVL